MNSRVPLQRDAQQLQWRRGRSAQVAVSPAWCRDISVTSSHPPELVPFHLSSLAGCSRDLIWGFSAWQRNKRACVPVRGSDLLWPQIKWLCFILFNVSGCRALTFRQSLAVAGDHRRVPGGPGDSKGWGQMPLVVSWQEQEAAPCLWGGKGGRERLRLPVR